MKIRSMASLLTLIMLYSGIVCSEEYNNLLLGGINQTAPCADCSKATNLEYHAIANDLKANYFPMYYHTKELDNIGEVQSAATGEASDQNGLTNAALQGTENDPKEYDTIIAYSGGTATALTALANYNEYRVKCGTLILISPMSAGVSDEVLSKIRKTYEEDCGGKACWKLLGNALDIATAKDQISANYSAQVRAMLESEPPVVNKIIVITSPQDELMPYLSDIFQVKTFEEYTKNDDGSAINPDVTIITQDVPLIQFEEDGREAHIQLFFEYAKTHLSNADGGEIEFNPEGNQAVVNEEETDEPVGISTDSNPPVVQAFQVTPQDMIIGGYVTINYTVSDNDRLGLRQVELWRLHESSDWQKIRTENVAGETSPVSGSFTDSHTALGKYWYGVHVVDNAGNWNDEKNSNSNNSSINFEPVEVNVESAEQSLREWAKSVRGSTIDVYNNKLGLYYDADGYDDEHTKGGNNIKYLLGDGSPSSLIAYSATDYMNGETT